MPKRYTPISAAADVEAALRLHRAVGAKLVYSLSSVRRQGSCGLSKTCERGRFANITEKMLGHQLQKHGSGWHRPSLTAYPEVPPRSGVPVD